MKNISKVLLITVVFCQQAWAQSELNVMTFNIRYNTPKDSINAWPNRKDFVADMIKYYDADLVGYQEALYGQITDSQERLPAYAWVGKGRDNGDTAGEFSCIFYKKEKFKLLETSTFWLSETPEKVGWGWEAKYNRVCTWAKFKTAKKNKTFFVFNTHFDHQAPIARRESAKLLLQRVKEIAGNMPVIIMGDFNATPSEEPIKILLDSQNPNHFIDTEQLSQSPHFGPFSSFNGFTNTEQEGRHIDYIFLNKPVFIVKKHATLTNTWQGRFASDHHPVLATLQFK